MSNAPSGCDSFRHSAGHAAWGSHARSDEGLAAAHSAGESLGDMDVRANRESGLRDHFSRKREDRERIENLDERVNAAREFEQEASGEAGLADFVSHLSHDTGKSDAHVSRGPA